MDAALYIRCSTREQHPENQEHDLRAWAKRLGARVVEVYTEKRSGGSDSRPGLKAMLQAAHERRFDVVLVAALDRLSRGGIRSTLDILEKLHAAGVPCRSLREPWLEMSDPRIRELIISLLAWVAETERLQRRERVLSGMRRARREGKHLGRPRVSVDVDMCQRAVALFQSQRAAAKHLQIDESTVRRRLAEVP